MIDRVLYSSLLCVTLYLLSCPRTDAQNIIFQGKIVDPSNGPLSYANIYRGAQGVFSNLDGDFRLIINGSNKGDTIYISCVGFESKKILIDTVNSDLFYTINLIPNITYLDEIEIVGSKITLTPNEIVKNALNQFEIFRKKFSAHVIEAFFRQINVLENKSSHEVQYLQYTEAALEIHRTSIKDSHLSIKEVRRSNDKRYAYISDGSEEARRLKVKEEERRFDLSEHLLKLDHSHGSTRIKKEYTNLYSLLDPAVGGLSNDFAGRHKFKLDSLTIYNNEMVYVIKILPDRKSTGIKSGPLKDYFLPVGRLIISVDDFAILEYQYNYIVNPGKRRGMTGQIVRLMAQGDYVFKDRIRYQRYNDTLMPSYIMREQGDTLFIGGFNGQVGARNGKDLEGMHFKIRREIFFTDVRNPTEVANRIAPKYFSVLPETFSYNKDFWQGINKILPSNFDDERFKILGNGMSIEEQFARYGSSNQK